MLSRVKLFNLKKASALLTNVRLVGHENKYWKAGPYPKTEEERIAAAKKYNLLPEEYEPYPDDGDGAGDYPKLPFISAINRDHYYAWDYPESLRNYGEALHIYENILTEERMEIPYCDFGIHNIPFWKQYAMFFTFFFGFIGITLVTNHFNAYHYVPQCAIQMPEPGKTHYTYKKD